MPVAYQINWGPVLDHRHAFLLGAWIDVWITVISFLLACVLGIAIALLRNSGLRVLSWPAFVYVQLVRGVPLLVFLYWVYFGLAILTGLAFTSSQAAIVALSVTGSAYTAQIFRAAITAVDPGHVQAPPPLPFPPP